MLALVVMLVAAAAPAGEIRIGLVASLSTPTGISMRNGARLGAAAVNQRGGVLGRRLALVERDDGLDPDEGARAVEQLVRGDRVAAIIGPNRTIVAEALADVANRARVPLVIAGATGSRENELLEGSSGSYVFRLALSDAIQASLIAREAIEVRGFRRPAIVADTSAYGKQGRERLQAALRVRGTRPVAVEAFALDLEDPGPLVARVRAASPDVVLLFSHALQLARVVRAMERLRFRVPVIGCWTLGQREFLDRAGPYAEGAVMPSTLIEDAPGSPEAQRFVASYRAAFGAAPIPEPSAAAQAHDAVQLVAAAIAQAGSEEGPSVKRALEDLRAAPRGAIRRHWHPFGPNDHDGLKRGDVTMGVVRDGRVRPAGRRGARRRRPPAAPRARTASRGGRSARGRGTRALAR